MDIYPQDEHKLTMEEHAHVTEKGKLFIKAGWLLIPFGFLIGIFIGMKRAERMCYRIFDWYANKKLNKK